ncbi:hypothetical protein L0Y49_01850 [bacterium]|nr:hypothetical protein [bacterium]
MILFIESATEGEFMYNSPELWQELFQRINVFWIHDRNPQRPYALFTSGLHAAGYFNSDVLFFEHPAHGHSAARGIAESLEADPLYEKPDRVIAPAMGGIVLASGVAQRLGTACGYIMYTGAGKNKRFFVPERIRIKEGERVLVVDDVMSTGGSVEATIRTLEDAGAVVLPIVGVLCSYNVSETASGKKVVSLFRYSMPTWDQGKCPFGEEVLSALRPKQNWDTLTQTYPKGHGND